MDMKEQNTPLLSNINGSYKEVMLSDLVLISVRRVAEGSVQAFLGVRGG